MMRNAALALSGLLVFLALALAPARAGDEAAASRQAPQAPSEESAQRPILLVLPVQDRVGDPETARLAEGAIRAALRHRYVLPDTTRVRDLMRKDRLRDPTTLRPSLVAGLAEATGAEEILVVTLLAAGGREVPVVTLSAQAIVPGEIELSWAGFVARDGLDSESALGLGRVETLEELVSLSGRELALAFLERSGPETEHEPPLQDVYRRRDLSFDALSPAVVVPFGADLRAQTAAATQIATDLTLATLDAQGVRILWPGALHELLIHKPHPSIGEVRPSDRALIRSALKVRALVTGKVEYRHLSGTLERPEPEVGYGARVIDAETGDIVWTAGVAVGGWDEPGLFGVSRTYGLDTLSEDALASLLASIEGPATVRTLPATEQP